MRFMNIPIPCIIIFEPAIKSLCPRAAYTNTPTPGILPGTRGVTQTNSRRRATKFLQVANSPGFQTAQDQSYPAMLFFLSIMIGALWPNHASIQMRSTSADRDWLTLQSHVSALVDGPLAELQKGMKADTNLAGNAIIVEHIGHMMAPMLVNHTGKPNDMLAFAAFGQNYCRVGRMALDDHVRPSVGDGHHLDKPLDQAEEALENIKSECKTFADNYISEGTLHFL